MAGHNDTRIRVAISGGGLAGATLARSLMKLPNIDLRIYESAPAFKEWGAAVGLTQNAQQALQLIDPELWASFDLAGALQMNGMRTIVGEGPYAGSWVCDIATDFKPSIVHRGQFLDQLLKPVPAKVMHANKKLVRIEDTGSEVTLRFQDGTASNADVLIGADGIHGQSRKFILGDDDPATDPVFSGFWDTRNLVPAQQAVEKLGQNLINIQDPHQFVWIGDGSFILYDVLSKGTVVQTIGAVFANGTWDPTKWKEPLSHDRLLEHFTGFGPVGEGISELLADQQNLTAFSQWEHRNAATYTQGRVCMMGDAAHVMTPWQGSGAGQAIEDALILKTVLGEAKSPSEVTVALRAYDEIRRPRTQRVVESSHETGLLMTGKVPGVGLDPQKLRDALEHRWDFIHEINLQQSQQDALNVMRRLRQN